MKTINFTNTTKAATLYGIMFNELRQSGHESGFLSITEPYMVKHGDLEYTVSPISTKDTTDMDGVELMYVHVQVHRINESVSGDKMVVNSETSICHDMMAAICMLSGVNVVMVNNEALWQCTYSTKSMVRTLAKYIGYVAAAALVAGLIYYGYTKIRG
tara:strand:+ start:4022 stop:4495 length:474 start_codon:yes stop_codon:yes gene_type:complete